MCILMAVPAVNTFSIFRYMSSPPLASIRCHLCQLPALQCRRITKSVYNIPNSQLQSLNFHAVTRNYSGQSLVHTVMEELQNMRKRKKVRASNNMGLTSNGQLLEDKLERRELKKGFLLEFKKDSDRLLLAVAQKPDGKKNWMVADQHGVTTSIKPQQITFIVPGVENFDHAEICDFIQKAQDNLDPSLLEFAWIELLENSKSVTVVELAKMIFGSMEPLESYCTHLLLSKDEIYFTVLESRGPCSVYAPRTALQVEEHKHRKLLKEAADKEFDEFVMLLKSAKSMPPSAKPSKTSWKTDHKIHQRINSLEAYAIDACKNDDQKTAGMILKAMGLAKTSSSAVDLLVNIGYFPVHVNLELLKLNIHTHHSDEDILAAESLLLESIDLDEADRIDLTHLKVYAIDVDEADELDDALSARRMEDGRIQVWIHVADPTSLVQPGSKLDREALRRGTSVFLPTATYPMFPEKLAMEGMSLKQGMRCRAVTVSVVLHSDGSIAEISVENSIIKPTYMLTYHSATELLYLNLEEEGELKILEEAASLRFHWRQQQGAIDTTTIETRIKVANPDDPMPSINLYVENQAEPAMRLVSEMMILCGEAIATYGSSNNIPLPFRGQPQSNIDVSAFAHLPEGPVRSSAIVRVMRAAEMDFRKPVRHGVLGLPGYVQFTSPIRRYMDLLAHYQVKAFLRSDSLPFSSGQLEGMASIVNMNVRIKKKLGNISLRYWVLEYLRRQPKEAKFHALVLRFIKDKTASLLIMEVGIQASAWVSTGVQIGDEVEVKIVEAHPRDDILTLKALDQNI
ncbi:ribonuclease II, chloroplastic/mitochondrial-like [Impatiens glandulifera]|uniref:ribonuclease II, chloroplastic/mitochondrial-like n=1 Tax=Impatiens glandulifera TaxID=253017 RepID=UPI001FB108B6|nr:ribonuclease II, chloroplastic/mitochondrial-like [Impatiens glandulifera]